MPPDPAVGLQGYMLPALTRRTALAMDVAVTWQLWGQPPVQVGGPLSWGS